MQVWPGQAQGAPGTQQSRHGERGAIGVWALDGWQEQPPASLLSHYFILKVSLAREHPDLNRGPPDLQSHALPPGSGTPLERCPRLLFVALTTQLRGAGGWPVTPWLHSHHSLTCPPVHSYWPPSVCRSRCSSFPFLSLPLWPCFPLLPRFCPSPVGSHQLSQAKTALGPSCPPHWALRGREVSAWTGGQVWDRKVARTPHPETDGPFLPSHRLLRPLSLIDIVEGSGELVPAGWLGCYFRSVIPDIHQVA